MNDHELLFVNQIISELFQARQMLKQQDVLIKQQNEQKPNARKSKLHTSNS